MASLYRNLESITTPQKETLLHKQNKQDTESTEPPEAIFEYSNSESY